MRGGVSGEHPREHATRQVEPVELAVLSIALVRIHVDNEGVRKTLEDCGSSGAALGDVLENAKPEFEAR